MIVLFVLLTPGILLRLPPKGSLLTVAIVHGLVFALVFHLTYRIVYQLSEAFANPPSPEPCPDGLVRVTKEGHSFCTYRRNIPKIQQGHGNWVTDRSSSKAEIPWWQRLFGGAPKKGGYNGSGSNAGGEGGYTKVEV